MTEVLDIATGRSRKETSWRNTEMTWLAFTERLATTHVTAETHAEYMAAKKPRQDEIKDIGGFVGGYLTGGRRKASNVLHRQLVTLDLDFCTADFWNDFQLMYACAAVMYSTHKHSPTTPRLRLIVPLDRPVRPDEYEAISRRIAGVLGVELFDPTTFQPERLMYWPSTSKGAEYLYELQAGEWLSADAVLATYKDWKDSSAWPVSSKVDSVIKKSMLKQGDPTEKPGVVGAFCRTYTIEEVLDTYLADVYDPCDTEGRYTYKEGSTAAGLIVYEEKYAYSHHGTDPTSGKLCNAFDLVRLHKFGLKDEDVREGTPGNKLPSYTAMIDFATRDEQVKKQLGGERLEAARADFAGIEPLEEPANDDWVTKLEVDRKGNYYQTIDNLALILENDSIFKNNIAFDDFEKRAIVRKALPWRKVTHQTRYLVDRDDDNIEHYIETIYKIGGAKLEKAMSVIYEKTMFHPVRDYLKSVAWDGVERVDTLFIDYMGAKDNDYTRAVTRKTLCAAVARIFEPGCKFDYMLTFVGKQGLGKSSLIGKLGKQWYSDSFSTVQGKEAFEQIQGVWLVEVAELSGLRKADVESTKHYISKREDRYRVAYGKRVENFPRQCIFFGSTNKPDFLKDATGNRRFWPVATGTPSKNVFKDLTDLEINQIWAEVVHYYNAGETLYLSKELELIAAKVQEEHSETDDRVGLVQAYLEKLLPVDWDDKDIFARRAFLQGGELQELGLVRRDRVCAAEIWCEVLGGFQKDMSSHNTRFIHDIMRAVPGWFEYPSRSVFRGYGNQKGYYRKGGPTATGVQKNTTVTTVSQNGMN